MNFKISAFPSDKCLYFLPVHLYFYLSRKGGQSIISIPAVMILNKCDLLHVTFIKYCLKPGIHSRMSKVNKLVANMDFVVTNGKRVELRKGMPHVCVACTVHWASRRRSWSGVAPSSDLKWCILVTISCLSGKLQY